MSIPEGIRKTCRIIGGSLCAFLLFLNSLSPLAQHSIDRHIGFWMLWGFLEILLLLSTIALFTPAAASAQAIRWQARMRLLGGGLIALFGCLIALLFKSDGLVLSAVFIIVGSWLLFTAVRAERRASKKAEAIRSGPIELR